MSQSFRGLRGPVFACLLLASFATRAEAQDGIARFRKEAAEAERRLTEEKDRLEKKRAAVKLEFDALQTPDVRIALSNALEAIAKKYGDAARAEPADSAGEISNVMRTLQSECAAALRDSARNISSIADLRLARGLVDALKADAEPSFAVVVGEALTETFGGATDFDRAWSAALASEFDKEFRAAESEALAAKSRLEDAEQAAKNAASGAPPGMIEVRGGKFEIGDSAAEYRAAIRSLGHGDGRELPLTYYGAPKKTVELAPFYLDQNETTNRQWAEFCRATGRTPPKHWVATSAKENGSADSRAVAAVDSGTGMRRFPEPVPPVMGRAPYPGTEDVPVTNITWDDAAAYCAFIGRRLPTEEEWEAAARIDSDPKKRRLYSFGDAFSRAKAPCNYLGAVNDDRIRSLAPVKGGDGKTLPTLTPVGSWPESKSALGFNDLAGNAIEMTSSPFARYPGWAHDKLPEGSSAGEAFDDLLVVMRGGHYKANELMLMPSMRRGWPKYEAVDPAVGFRTAASKDRAKDIVDVLATSKLFQSKLADVGAAFKDEAKLSRFPMLDVASSDSYGAVLQGGWDAERNLPAKAAWIGACNRATKEFSDPAKVRILAKDAKEALFLGWFRTDVALKTPEVPPGEYWVMWLQVEEKDPVTKKTTHRSDLVFRNIDSREVAVIEKPRLTFVSNSSEATKIRPSVDGASASVIYSFKTISSSRGRLILEFDIAPAAPGGFLGFK